MAQLRYALVLALLTSLMAGPAAQAASWPSLPAACTPDRAAQWDGGISESNQVACHCPPPSLCPATYEEYSNPALAKMPTALINRCCPSLSPPTCTSGTILAGQPVPQSGNCNPVCPIGTALEGQPLPADGNCNPASPCPAKYYPTMTETETTAMGTRYVYQDGQSFDFDLDAGGADQDDCDGCTLTKSLSRHYGYSLRIGDRAYWLYTQSCSYFGTCGSYERLTNGVNTSRTTLASVVGALGRDNLTWFGLSVADPRYLGNNRANPAIISIMGSSNRLQIRADVNSSQSVPISSALSSGAGEFVNQCLSVAGEYVELEYKTIDGNQCAYLQCRYVFSGLGQESCLASDVKVTLADGSSRPVKELKLGDVVKGSTGDHKIVASNIYQSGLRVLYGINGGAALLTGDHPLHTKDGWKVINPESAKLYADKAGFAKTALTVGDVLITDKGEVVVKSIERHAKVNPISTYNIKVDGNAGFFANGIEVKGFDKMEMKYE